MSNDVFEIPWLKFSQDNFSLSLASDSISKKSVQLFFLVQIGKKVGKTYPFLLYQNRINPMVFCFLQRSNQ